MKKLDIMNAKEPGKWAIIGGKIQRIEEIIPTEVKIEEKIEIEDLEDAEPVKIINKAAKKVNKSFNKKRGGRR